MSADLLVAGVDFPEDWGIPSDQFRDVKEYGPTYEAAIEKCFPNGVTGNALLAGCQCDQSAHGFLEQVPNASSADVIDLEIRFDPTTLRYIQGDILNPPIEVKGNYQVILTNYLLNNLIGDERMRKQVMVQRAVLNLFQMLEPGGVLVMVEDGWSIVTVGSENVPIVDIVQDVITSNGIRSERIPVIRKDGEFDIATYCLMVYG